MIARCNRDPESNRTMQVSCFASEGHSCHAPLHASCRCVYAYVILIGKAGYTLSTLRVDAEVHLRLTMASRAQTRARSVASDTLRAAAARGTAEGRVSRSLEGLAAAAESESFGKVREAIDGMIRELKMQQSTDAKKKDWCKLELFEIQKATEAASDHQTSLNLRSSQMEQDIKALQGALGCSDCFCYCYSVFSCHRKQYALGFRV